MDPCEFCIDKYGIDDINSVNNCCFQKCANISGKDNVWEIIPTPCGQNCMKCLKKAKLHTGRSLCYQRGIVPPPIFVENYDADYGKSRSMVFYIAFAITTVILSIVIIVMLKVIFGNNKYK